MLPTFLVIGAVKAGTTSLFEYLRTHPDVFMPEAKELSFFVAEQNWSRGLDWYERQFAAADGAAARGEASPSYAWHPSFPGVPGRIATVLPNVRLVYLVRHPIERLRSMYLHAVARGAERRPIERALFETTDYVDCSRYATQLDRYLEWFGREQLLVVTSEALRDSRLATVRLVMEFIGVDADWTPPNLHEEAHRTDQKLPAEAMSLADTQIPVSMQERLAEVFRPEIERLAPLVSSPFAGWGLL